MSTKSQQAQQVEQKSVEPEADRNRATGRYRGRAAMAVVTIAIGTALTALVIGVTGGTEPQAPPSPGFSPPYGNEVPPKGLDQRLYELAEKHAEQKPFTSPKGIDQRLYNLVEDYVERQGVLKDSTYANEVPPQGVDQRLYELAEEFAARQRTGHPSVRGH